MQHLALSSPSTDNRDDGQLDRLGETESMGAGLTVAQQALGSEGQTLEPGKTTCESGP